MGQWSLPLLHVLFSTAAGGTVRRALAQEDRPDLAADLHDILSFGPLDGDAEARARWVDEMLGITNWHAFSTRTRAFLDVACTPHIMPVAWFSRRDAQSYAGFLWWLSHLGDVPCKVVDITDLKIRYPGRNPYLAVNPSELSSDHVLDVIDDHAPLSDADRAAYREQWRRLAAENAPLRVIDAQGSLVSAPITHFDELLMSVATPAWRKMSLMLGQARTRSWTGEIRQTSDLVLHSRLCELAESGALEWRGDLTHLGKCELRLPGGRN